MKERIKLWGRALRVRPEELEELISGKKLPLGIVGWNYLPGTTREGGICSIGFAIERELYASLREAGHAEWPSVDLKRKLEDEYLPSTARAIRCALGWQADPPEVQRRPRKVREKKHGPKEIRNQSALRSILALVASGVERPSILQIKRHGDMARNTLLAALRDLVAEGCVEYHRGQGGRGGHSWARPLEGPGGGGTGED